MVKLEQREDLAHLYQLLFSIPKALTPVVAEFEAHVTEQGRVGEGEGGAHIGEAWQSGQGSCGSRS